MIQYMGSPLVRQTTKVAIFLPLHFNVFYLITLISCGVSCLILLRATGTSEKSVLKKYTTKYSNCKKTLSIQNQPKIHSHTASKPH